MKEKLGWVKLYRKLLDWKWFGHLNTQGVFIYLLLAVNSEDKEWMGVEIKRGQIATSIEHLGELLHLSRAAIRNSLNNLQRTQEIAIKTNKHYTIITVNKYSDYQVNNHPTTNHSAIQSPYLRPLLKNIKNKEYITLESVDGESVKEIATKYQVSVPFVEKLKDEMEIYCGSKGVKYANYKLALMGWVRRRVEDKPQVKLKDLSPHQIEDIRNNPFKLSVYKKAGYDTSRLRSNQ